MTSSISFLTMLSNVWAKSIDRFLLLGQFYYFFRGCPIMVCVGDI
jgi:hypothetical protein